MLSKRMLLTAALGAVLFAPAGVRGEDNKALVRRWIEEVLSKGNVALVEEFIPPTYVGHFPGRGEVKGPEAIKQAIPTLRTAFPDIHYTIEDLVAEGDKVVARNTLRGTHRGEYLGLAPSGKQVTWTTIYIFHIVNGKFQEGWLLSDLEHQVRLLSAQRQSKQ